MNLSYRFASVLPCLSDSPTPCSLASTVLPARPGDAPAAVVGRSRPASSLASSPPGVALSVSCFFPAARVRCALRAAVVRPSGPPTQLAVHPRRGGGLVAARGRSGPPAVHPRAGGNRWPVLPWPCRRRFIPARGCYRPAAVHQRADVLASSHLRIRAFSWSHVLASVVVASSRATSTASCHRFILAGYLLVVGRLPRVVPTDSRRLGYLLEGRDAPASVRPSLALLAGAGKATLIRDYFRLSAPTDLHPNLSAPGLPQIRMRTRSARECAFRRNRRLPGGLYCPLVRGLASAPAGCFIRTVSVLTFVLAVSPRVRGYAASLHSLASAAWSRRLWSPPPRRMSVQFLSIRPAFTLPPTSGRRCFGTPERLNTYSRFEGRTGRGCAGRTCSQDRARGEDMVGEATCRRVLFRSSFISSPLRMQVASWTVAGIVCVANGGEEVGDVRARLSTSRSC